MRRVGVIGSLVWDVIHGRHARDVPVEEWGGIGYALAGLDAALPHDWEMVPIIKVGNDLAASARHFVSQFSHLASDAALIAVPYPNPRVELRYSDVDRRADRTFGGVPGWNWSGLKPVLDLAQLDALYINFHSGWEIDLETAQLIRRQFGGPIYGDLHMLLWALSPAGIRTLRPIPNVREWCECFDFLQVNEAEMHMLAPDPMALAATALHAGVRSLAVTMGKRGAVYFAAPDFETIADVTSSESGRGSGPLRTVRTALVPAEQVEPGDPTGCGDVWGATHFTRLLAGDTLHAAMLAANRAAARNVGHRGANGLADHLRGRISLS